MKTIENILFGVAILVMLGCLLMAALLLSGCASWYEPKISTITIPAPVGAKGVAPGTSVQVTMFSQWTDVWSAVCGAVVQYQNGQPAQMIGGNCATPLTMIAGSPANIGLAAALIPLLK